MATVEVLRVRRDTRKSPDSLEGEDHQADDQGDDGHDVTHHGQVVETDGELRGGKVVKYVM